MNYFDIAILVVLGLFLLWGLWKGFVKTGLSLLGWGVAITLIYFFAAEIGAFIDSSAVGGWINDGIFKAFNGNELFNVELVDSGNGLVLGGSGIAITDALKEAHIPSFLQNSILGFMSAGGTIASGLSKGITTYIDIVIAALAILIVTGIVFSILKLIFRRAIHAIRLGWLDRLLGCVIGIAVGILAVSALMTIIDMMSGFGFMSEAIAVRDSGTISQLFMKYNPFGLLLDVIIK